MIITMESVEFMAAQFLWYYYPHRIYILDEIILRKSYFLTETETRRIHEITSPQVNKKKKTQSPKKTGHHIF